MTAEREKSVEKLLSLGGRLERDEHSPDKPVVFADLGCRREVTDSVLACLRGLTGLRWLNLENTVVSDTGIEHLRGLGELRHLDLTGDGRLRRRAGPPQGPVADAMRGPDVHQGPERGLRAPQAFDRVRSWSCWAPT